MLSSSRFIKTFHNIFLSISVCLSLYLDPFTNTNRRCLVRKWLALLRHRFQTVHPFVITAGYKLTVCIRTTHNVFPSSPCLSFSVSMIFGMRKPSDGKPHWSCSQGEQCVEYRMQCVPRAWGAYNRWWMFFLEENRDEVQNTWQNADKAIWTLEHKLAENRFVIIHEQPTSDFLFLMQNESRIRISGVQ